MNRSKAREYAFILIFQYKFQPDDIREIVEDFFEEYDAGTQAEYIRNVVGGVAEKADRLDEKIEGFSKGWSKSRISLVSLAAMRLCVYEMLYCGDIPNTVSVNEAVGLIKKYEGEEATSFANGVLGNIQKSLEKTASGE